MAIQTDLDDVLEFAQEALALAPVIILGSGASAAHGVPGMWPLATHLKNGPGVPAPSSDECTQWTAFIAQLDADIDLEAALGAVRLSDRQTAYVANETRTFLLPYDEAVFSQILTDRRALPLSRLYRHFFSSVHRTIDVITPNYDRLAEYAADAAGFAHQSGFTAGYLQTRLPTHVPKVSGGNDTARTVCVWKVHGSLDWFENAQHQIIGVRGCRETPAGFAPLMITPGIDKYRLAHMEPFRTIFTCSDAALEKARSYLCIGYGFNDAHLQTKLIERCESDAVPIIVITKTLSEPAKAFLNGGRCRKYLALEECDSGTRAYLHTKPAGVELVGQRIWAMPDFLDLTLGAHA
jgi:hypothetical protein